MSENPEPTKTSRELDRLVFFNDAVFAIAITLLALEIRIPIIPGTLDNPAAEALVFRDLLELLPTLWSFIVSFFAIAVFWIGNHTYHHYIVAYNRRFLWINLIFLMFIVLIPAASALLGINVFNRVATITYALIISATSAAATWLWWYASYRHRLVAPNLDQKLIDAMNRRNRIAPLLFLASIPIALVSPLVAQVLWYGFLGYTIILGLQSDTIQL